MTESLPPSSAEPTETIVESARAQLSSIRNAPWGASDSDWGDMFSTVLDLIEQVIRG